MVSLLTPPENAGRTNRFFLLLRTRIGDEHVLRDAGMIEIPGSGSFEDPGDDAPDRIGATARYCKPSKATIVGFLWVSVIAAALIATVKLLAAWLQTG